MSKRQAKNKLAGVCECFVRVFSQRDAFQFHCCCAPYCHVLDLMSHGTKYIVHQDETILATVSLVFRYLHTTKNSIKKLLYKSVGINSAVFKGLDKSSGGIRPLNYIAQWKRIRLSRSGSLTSTDGDLLSNSSCLSSSTGRMHFSTTCPMRIETVAEKIPGYLPKLNGVMHQIWP